MSTTTGLIDLSAQIFADAVETNVFGNTTAIPNQTLTTDGGIQFGDVQHLPTNNPTLDTINEAQDQERNLHEPTDEHEYIPSPMPAYNYADSPVPLSNDVQNAGRNYNVLDDEIIFVQRESIAGPVESEVEDETPDSPAIESVENEVQHDPLNDGIEHALNLDPIVIDLTSTDDEEEAEAVLSVSVQSPPLIDLTQDDSVDDTVNDQPVIIPDIEERPSILQNETTDQPRAVNEVADDLSRQIESSIPPPSRTKKRASSNIEILSNGISRAASTSKRSRRLPTCS